MKHVKRVSAQKAQTFDIDDSPFNQPITFWAWIGSIVFFFKDYTGWD